MLLTAASCTHPIMLHVAMAQVVKYVQALTNNSTFAPKLSDIGIITPYRKQVRCQ